MRTLRRVLFWLLDLAVIVAVVWCIVHFSRRKSVACSWQGMRGSCSVETEDSLGRVATEHFDGVRGPAYVHGDAVGLVTDAQNKDEAALFGTRDIELERPSDARALYDFADQRSPDRVSYSYGVAHPRWMTAGLLALLVAYAFVSGRARRRATNV